MEFRDDAEGRTYGRASVAEDTLDVAVQLVLLVGVEGEEREGEAERVRGRLEGHANAGQ